MTEFGCEASCGLAFLWFPEEISSFYCIFYFLYFQEESLHNQRKYHVKERQYILEMFSKQKSKVN